MKFKKLKCESCGADLELDENKEYGNCPYCKTKYKLNEDINVNINLDDNVKSVFNSFGKRSKLISIIFIIIFITAFIFILFTFISSFNNINKFNDNKNNIESTINKGLDELDVSYFNNKLDLYKGSISGYSARTALSYVIDSNNSNKNKLITVIYNDISTADNNEIENIMNNLPQSKDYDLSFEYDIEGFINLVTIKESNN